MSKGKEGRKSRAWVVKLIVAVLVIAAAAGVFVTVQPYVKMKLGLGTAITSIDDLKPNEVMGFKKYVSDAVLGEARQKQELVVWEQDVQVDTDLSSALLNLGIFEKTKTIHTYGTGVYTVDMSQITSKSVAVDTDKKTVTLAVPRTYLQYIEIDSSKTTFEDTQHALLGFGDIEMTQEQQAVVDEAVRDAMRESLTSEECFADADEAALLMVYDTYQPIVEQLSPDLFLNVVFTADSVNQDVSAGSGADTEASASSAASASASASSDANASASSETSSAASSAASTTPTPSASSTATLGESSMPSSTTD